MYFKRRPLPLSPEDPFEPPKDQVSISFKLVDGQGNVYSMEEEDLVVEFSSTEYRAGGFAYEAIQGNKIGRIKFRGYLRRNDEPGLVYVQIRFLCLYFSKLFDHQRLFDDSFFGKELKEYKGKELKFFIGDLLEDKMEQFCQIKGTFKVEDEDESELFFLGTIGRRFLSSKSLLSRKIVMICGFDIDGTGFQIGLVNHDGLSYYYGFVSKRGENFKVLNKPVNMTKEDFSQLGIKTEKDTCQLELTFDGKLYKFEVMPHKGSSRLVKVNGVDGK